MSARLAIATAIVSVLAVALAAAQEAPRALVVTASLVSGEGPGELDAASVERMFRARRAAFARCAESARDGGEAVVGAHDVALTVQETGSVTGVRLIGGSTTPTFASCTTRLVSGFRFSPGAAGGVANFTFRLLVEIGDGPAPERSGDPEPDRRRLDPDHHAGS